jgi:hypothetical protein
MILPVCPVFSRNLADLLMLRCKIDRVTFVQNVCSVGILIALHLQSEYTCSQQ